MPITSIDGVMLKEMFLSGAALLERNRQNVDALNVFPVPDGDTGTNMSQTMSAAVRELNARSAPTVGDVANTVARGALKGARGNSGVILSQIFRGISRRGRSRGNGRPAVCKTLRQGADTAYKAVMKPKEGTILTVARFIAEETEKVADRYDDVAGSVQGGAHGRAMQFSSARRRCCPFSSRRVWWTAAAWA